MDKRHKAYRLLYTAIIASAVVSIGLATMTTAQLNRERLSHRAAPVATETVLEKQARATAAATEKAERQKSLVGKTLRDLRIGQ